MTACFRSAAVPARQELVEAGEALLAAPCLREVAQALGDELAVRVQVLDALGDDRDGYAVDVVSS